MAENVKEVKYVVDSINPLEFVTYKDVEKMIEQKLGSSKKSSKEEMEMIDKYLAIQKTRFGERLQSDISCDPALRHYGIPCMILQPLVENAVIHGAEPLLRTVTIRVKAFRQDAGIGCRP